MNSVLKYLRRLRLATRGKTDQSSTGRPGGSQAGDKGLSTREAVIVLAGAAVGIAVGMTAGLGPGLVAGFAAAAALNGLLRPGS